MFDFDFSRRLLGIGLKPEQIDPSQVALRAILVYIATLAIVRMGKRRFMARATAFDVIIGIMIGSIAGRAVTGNAPVGNALVGVAMMMAVHWIISAIAVRSHPLGLLINGNSKLLIREGQVDHQMLRREHMTRDDLEEELRLKGHKGPQTIEEGRLERSGQLSLLSKRKALKVLNVSVQDGIQTIRIEL